MKELQFAIMCGWSIWLGIIHFRIKRMESRNWIRFLEYREDKQKIYDKILLQRRELNSIIEGNLKRK